MDDWQILLSDLRIAAFRDGKVFVAALAEPGVPLGIPPSQLPGIRITPCSAGIIKAASISLAVLALKR
jgi:hypothetical protein